MEMVGINGLKRVFFRRRKLGEMKLRDGHIKVAVQVLYGIKFDSVIRKLQGLVPLAQLAGNVRQTEVGRNKIRIHAGSLSTYADGFLGAVVRNHQLAQQGPWLPHSAGTAEPLCAGDFR